MESAKQNFKVQQWITALSVILFVVKIIAYYQTHSLAILSDALESIVNVLAGFIGLYSLWVASKPRDIDHPYGHGKAEFVSAAVEGGLIISAGILILYESIQNLISSKPLQALDNGLWLVGITAVLNYIAGFICVAIGRRNKSLALEASGKHLKVDTYSTLAIIAGLIIMLYTKLYWLDKVISFIMAGIVIYNGYKIVRSSLAGIMDEADMELLEKMVSVLNANRRTNWIDLHNLRVIKYGSLLHVDCHLTVPWYLSVHDAHYEVDALEDLIKKEFGDALEMFVHIDGCLPMSCPICSKEDCPVRQHPFKNKLAWTLENILMNERHNEKTPERFVHKPHHVY
ncbi:cation diffusion facilitator family transporter [Danxiaibacter flavus]|uniref:Cation diffusion facilitator family transporter n=1 Tax=Danxiaibacter flavus TaxID=3049108 RepID=A0ABV3ZDI0_9BACT|nr:cation diffusion facilitator family transporter [Chitinophagaceae bacterium DXS]